MAVEDLPLTPGGDDDESWREILGRSGIPGLLDPARPVPALKRGAEGESAAYGESVDAPPPAVAADAL